MRIFAQRETTFQVSTINGTLPSENWHGTTDPLELQKSVFDYFDNQVFSKIDIKSPLETVSNPVLPAETKSWRHSIQCTRPENLTGTPSFFGDPGSKAIVLTWDPCRFSNVLGHRVYFSVGSIYNSLPVDASGWNQMKMPLEHDNSSTAVIDGLLPNTTYHFVVTAIDADGFESGYSKFVSVRTTAK